MSLDGDAHVNILHGLHWVDGHAQQTKCEYGEAVSAAPIALQLRLMLVCTRLPGHAQLHYAAQHPPD